MRERYDAYLTRKYSYENKCSADKAEAEMILLPATANGSPDWECMEAYMKLVMIKTKQNFEYSKEALKICKKQG